MTTPPTLREESLAAAAQAADAGRYWVPTDARELIVDAVLAIVARRDHATLDRIIADAEHHAACARLSAAKRPNLPQAPATHSGMAAAFHIAEGYLRADQPKEQP